MTPGVVLGSIVVGGLPVHILALMSRDRIPKVVFLCVHNAGRSQMAAAFARHLGGDRIDVFSGGSDPTSAVNPGAVEVMAEVGIDISAFSPQHWTDEIVAAADLVVTMGCSDECPLFPGVTYEEWPLSDPAGVPVEEIRTVRDDIRRRVARLLISLGIPHQA